MILEAPIWHKFIYKQELHASLILFGAVPNEFDQVWMVDHAQNIDLSQPLFMSLLERNLLMSKGSGGEGWNYEKSARFVVLFAAMCCTYTALDL
jgi:hypothetical protein